jgi:hypothetical protein
VTHDPPGPATVFRRIVGGALALAALALTVELAMTGDVEWRLVAFVLFLWALWAAGAHVADHVLGPLGRFLHGALFTGRIITLDDEIADLELRLATGRLPAEREILAGVRLAEIYRRHRADARRADALLDRLLAKHPDSAMLRAARGAAG